MSVCFFVPSNDQGAGGSAEEAGEVESGSPEAESNTADYTNATLQQFWAKVTDDIRKVTPDDFKTQVLPLARIKKIMKLDEDVKMISAEAPVLFARAAEIFIHELTLRAWVHTEDNKRRTLQRNDIAMAVSKSDQFDFLIDIVPRHEIKPAPKPREEPPRATSNNEQVQYYFQLAQQHQAALQSPPQQQQIILQPQIQTLQTSGASGGGGVGGGGGGGAQAVSVQQPVHILQQLVPGEMQQMPIQLTQAQVNMIRMQMQNHSGQPVIIQAQQQQQQHPPPQQIIQVSTQQQPQQQQVFLTQVGSTQDGD